MNDSSIPNADPNPVDGIISLEKLLFNAFVGWLLLAIHGLFRLIAQVVP